MGLRPTNSDENRLESCAKRCSESISQDAGVRGPICFNPAAVRSYVPQTIRKTELILAGQSKAQMAEDIKAALDKKELPALEAGDLLYDVKARAG
jgi:hypothetical protein